MPARDRARALTDRLSGGHPLRPDARPTHTPCVRDSDGRMDLGADGHSRFLLRALFLFLRGVPLERSGFDRVETSQVFGDQYLWATAEYAPMLRPEAVRPEAVATVGAVERYRERERTRIDSLGSALERLRALGPVAIWG